MGTYGMVAENRGESLFCFQRSVEVDPLNALARAMIKKNLVAVELTLWPHFEVRFGPVARSLRGGGEGGRNGAGSALIFSGTEVQLLKEPFQLNVHENLRIS